MLVTDSIQHIVIARDKNCTFSVYIVSQVKKKSHFVCSYYSEEFFFLPSGTFFSFMFSLIMCKVDSISKIT